MTDKFSPALVPAQQARTPYTGELTETIAPMPTKRTVRSRTFLPYQAWRFSMVNLRMVKMIRRSHAH